MAPWLQLEPILAQSNGIAEILDGDEIVAIVAISATFLTVAGTVISVAICNSVARIRTARIQAELLERLAERGFSADEIRSILAAAGSGKGVKNAAGQLPPRAAAPQKPVQKPVMPKS